MTLKDDQTTLLLYLLLHRNAHMKAFILSRTNIDSLVSISSCLYLFNVERNTNSFPLFKAFASQ